MAIPPLDGFGTHLAEKLWGLIPAIYRQRDGEGPDRHQLRALVEIIARQAAVGRRSQDRVWEDAFIESCDDWAVPYLADLVGTRLVRTSSQLAQPDELDLDLPDLELRPRRDPNRRGRRVDTAKTIYYRRRKGTLRVLEELTGDIAGFDGQVVEGFRRLARCVHSLDGEAVIRGRVSATPTGGVADLRRPLGAERTDGPFDEFAHLVDVRRHREPFGRYAIPKLIFHLYRLRAYRIDAAPLFPAGPGRYTADPRGRHVPLFAKRDRAEEWHNWTRSEPGELPARIPCRLLGHAEYRSSAGVEAELARRHPALSATALAALERVRGSSFPDEGSLRRLLGSLPSGNQLLTTARFRDLRELALDPACGKARLLAAAAGDSKAITVLADGVVVPPVDIVAADLSSWTSPPTGRRLAIDAERGRFRFSDGAAPREALATLHYGFPGDVGASSAPRPGLPAPSATLSGGLLPGLLSSGVVEFADSRAYLAPPDVGGVMDLGVQAASGARPYLSLSQDWILDSTPLADGALILDGLWIGGDGDLVLRGDFERVVIRSCTLDPGGEVDGSGGSATVLSPVALRIEARIHDLVIESSILGPIGFGPRGQVERTWLRDCIVQDVNGGRVIDLPRVRVSARRVTALGSVLVEELDASEVLANGLVETANLQAGCFRFSAAWEGSQLPHAYESHRLAPGIQPFASQRFGDPTYTLLRDGAPEFLVRGAENGSEIGVWSAAAPSALRMDALRAKIDEYAPFGAIPLYVLET